MTAVTSTDPRTGHVVATVAEETTVAQVDALCQLAAQAAPRLERLGRPFRAGVLRALADALEADRETIVGLADREDHRPSEQGAKRCPSRPAADRHWRAALPG